MSWDKWTTVFFKINKGFSDLGKRGSPGVTVVDTPGFNSSLQQMEDMVWLLAEVRTHQDSTAVSNRWRTWSGC